MTTVMAATMATTAGRSTTAIARATRTAGTTRAAVTGHSNLLTAHEGDGNGRDESRDPKN
jgi:hypothetical protein